MRVALIVAGLLLAACGEKAPTPVPGGSAANGKLLLRQFGCGGCHEIPEVADAKGRVGPPLAGVATRVYLAGVLPNTPENMVAFIQAPDRLVARTMMPNLGVTEAHARDMVAHLATLR